ncbi:hypothetical protein [Algibacter lectus]|uniref:DUF1963 domain-containing protein n=1 Tax=Algibacter lectus TaxID=221126 RepID=A0A090V9V6_9FLAO|nr:hypothetical protein [Algibacter lectus]GAL61571.1 hypothetical protein JCM19300_1394 [Algibacter lectus]
MAKLIFTVKKTENSIGYFGGGTINMPENIWPKIPKREAHQTHLCTLYPVFFKNGSLEKTKQISIFISIENHILGGVKETTSSKFTVNSTSDLKILNEGYSKVIIYDTKTETNNLSLSETVLGKKYFELDSSNKEKHMDEEHIFLEENGMGLDVSKFKNIPFFEQDIINPHPKYSFYLQLLEEDIENNLHVFQNGIGYFYLDKNIKKLKSGNEAGIFFIQNT